MMGGIGLIHNPFSGKNIRQPAIGNTLKRILMDHGVVQAPESIPELYTAIEAFQKSAVDIIAVNGGDGSLHQVLSAVLNVYSGPLPRFLLLRGGTMNTVCNSIKIGGDVISDVKRTVRAYRNNTPFFEKRQPLIRANQRHGFMTGAGIVARFLKTYYNGATGAGAAFIMVCKLIISTICRSGYAKQMFAPTRFHITIDGEKLNQNEYRFVLGCTIKELGLGFTPTPRAYEKPGHFHFIAASMGPSALLSKVPALWFGKDIAHPDLHCNDTVRKVTIEPEGLTEWMIDGDLYETDEPIVISCGPEITLIVP